MKLAPALAVCVACALACAIPSPTPDPGEADVWVAKRDLPPGHPIEEGNLALLRAIDDYVSPLAISDRALVVGRAPTQWILKHEYIRPERFGLPPVTTRDEGLPALPTRVPDPGDKLLTVLVAAVDLPQGVPVPSDGVISVSIPSQHVPDCVVRSPADVVGKPPREAILGGEFLRSERFDGLFCAP
jgi:flagella basal body P-ring formation protein FlgA